MITFWICVVLAALIYVAGFYRFKNYDYFVGTLVGGVVLTLIIMGSAAAGIW